MCKVEDLELGHRYLFLEQHVDVDHVFEGVYEEKSSDGKYSKLRFEDGTHAWKETRGLAVIEELPHERADIPIHSDREAYKKSMQILEEVKRKHAQPG